MSDFETWWEREGQEFLYALNTTTDDDIKLVAEVAWKNGAYCAEQADQEPVLCVECGQTVMHIGNKCYACCQKATREIEDALKASAPVHQAEQEPVAVVEITYGREPEFYVTGNIDDFPEGVFKLYTHPVRTKDLTDDEIVSVLDYYDHEWDETTFAIARAVIAADREKNK